MLILLGEQWRTFTNLCYFSSRWSSVSFGANLCPVASLSCICRSRQWGEDRWDPWSWRMERPSKTTLIILLQYDLMRAPPLVSSLLRLRSSHRSPRRPNFCIMHSVHIWMQGQPFPFMNHCFLFISLLCSSQWPHYITWLCQRLWFYWENELTKY